MSLQSAFCNRHFEIGRNRLRRGRRRRARLIGKRRVRRRQECDRHAVGRAANVIHSDLVAEDHRFGIAAVFAADADLQVGPGLASALRPDFEEMADAFLIERLERVVGEDLLLDIKRQEAARIVVESAIGA